MTAMALECTNRSRRSEVGRLNRMKRRGLSEAGRQHLRKSAMRHQPWRLSTGPVTSQGKARSARNGKLRQKGALSVREARLQLKADLLAIHSLLRRVGCDDWLVRNRLPGFLWREAVPG